jgi:hypothetical protein
LDDDAIRDGSDGVRHDVTRGCSDLDGKGGGEGKGDGGACSEEVIRCALESLPASAL